MTENYNPSGEEVAIEMMRDVGRNITILGRNLKEIGKNAFAGISFLTLEPYVLPTAIRSFREYDEKMQFNYTHHVGYTVGILAGFGLDYLQILGYIYAVNHDHPEVLAIPVMTNVASLLYEKSRKAREKLFLNRNVKTLDDVVEKKTE